MSLQSIDADLRAARAEFSRLNNSRWRMDRRGITTEKRIPLRTERRIVALALRIARLCKFQAMLAARAYAEDCT